MTTIFKLTLLPVALGFEAATRRLEHRLGSEKARMRSWALGPEGMPNDQDWLRSSWSRGTLPVRHGEDGSLPVRINKSGLSP